MAEEDKKEVPPVVGQSPESIVAQPATQGKAETQKEEKEEDPNWRAFREARKRDRIEKEAAEKKAVEKEAEVAALKAAMEAAFSKSSPQVPNQSNQYQGYAQEESEDERIEKKVRAALAVREAENEKARVEREHQEYPKRLSQTYSDFNQTISSENLDYLDYHYPEVSTPLKRQMDGYDKWSDIYKAVKKFVPNSVNARKDASKADANFNKPKSMSSSGISPAGGEQGSVRLSEERKAANWARMQKERDRLG